MKTIAMPVVTIHNTASTAAAIVNPRFRAPDNPWARPVAEPRNDL